MVVRDVMTPAIGSIGPGVGLREAFEQLRSLDIDPLPVLDDGLIVGLLHEDDVEQRARELGLGTSSETVSDVMRTEVLCCRVGQSVAEALTLVEGSSVAESGRRVPVIDDGGKLVGLVTLSDLRRRSGQQDERTIDTHVPYSIEQPVHFDRDSVDYMSDGSFPASDPLPPPTTLGPEEPNA